MRSREGGSIRVVNMIEISAYRLNAGLMNQWHLDGYLNSDAVTSKDSEYEVVKAGDAFAFAESMKPGFDIQASRNTSMPMVTAELTKPYTTTADVTSAMFAIPHSSRHPDRVTSEITACSRVDEEFAPAINTGELNPALVIAAVEQSVFNHGRSLSGGSVPPQSAYDVYE